MCLAHMNTFDSWISLSTYSSCVFLHRTNNARPKDPSPMTLSSEYFSIDQPQQSPTHNQQFFERRDLLRILNSLLLKRSGKERVTNTTK